MLRASKELPNRSSVGAMFVNRSATGDLAAAGRLEPDVGRGRASMGSGEYFTLAGFAARTETPGRLGRDYAFNVDSRYDDGTHEVGFEYGRTGEDFNPEVGFLENEFGYRRLQLRFQETMRQDWIREWHFREWLPHAIYTRYDYLDGGLNTAELHVDNHWDWENGYRIDTALQGSWEGFREPFEIYPGVIVPAGESGGLFFRMNSNTDRRKPISAALRWDVGTFLTGTQNSPRLKVTLRDGGRFTVDTTWTYSGDLAAAGLVPHQPREHAGDLQLHALDVRAEPGAVQRPHAGGGRATSGSTCSRPPAPGCSSSTTTPRASRALDR